MMLPLKDFAYLRPLSVEIALEVHPSAGMEPCDFHDIWSMVECPAQDDTVCEFWGGGAESLAQGDQRCAGQFVGTHPNITFRQDLIESPGEGNQGHVNDHVPREKGNCFLHRREEFLLRAIADGCCGRLRLSGLGVVEASV